MLVELSPKLALGLIAFVAGLIVLGVSVPLLALFAARRAPRSDDYVLRLLRNSAVPLVIQLANRGIDLGFAAVLYRVVAQQDVADYVFAAFLTTLLLATIAEWGLNIYLTREVARDPGAIERLFGTTLMIRLAFGALVIPLGLLVAVGYNALNRSGLIADGFGPQATLLLVILGATVLLDAFKGAVTALFMAVERPIVPAVANLLTNIVSALLKIAALVLGFGIVGVAWAALLATALSVGLFAWLQRHTWGWLPLRFNSALARTLLAAGLPLMLNALLLAVFFRFDITIIRAFSYDQLASYFAAYNFVGLTQILPPIVIGAVFPLFARQAASDRAALQRAYAYLIRLLLLLALPLATILSAFAPWWIALLAGEEYVPFGAPALAVLIWYLPLSYVNGITQYVLIALGRARTITLAFGLAAVFNLVFNLLFVPPYGIVAAAWATVLSEIVLFVPLWRALRQEITPVPLWRIGWRPLVAVGAMALEIWLIGRDYPLLGATLGVLMFGAMLWAMGVVQEEDRRLVRRVLRRS